MPELFTSAYQLLAKGGIVIIPLLLLSLLALAFTIERAFYLRRQRVIPADLLDLVDELIRKDKLSDALGACRMSRSNLARVFHAGLSKAEGATHEIEKAMEVAGKSEVANLSRHLHILSTVAGASPLLGLLGTVIGMIKTFSVIQMQGLSNTENLAGGISEALITTAVGLSIAIPYFIVARYFLAKVESLSIEMEEHSEQLLGKIQKMQAAATRGNAG